MREVLTWGGMPHTFTLSEGKHTLVGTFVVSKPRGKQTMVVRFPKGITLRQVVDAWEAQGKQWVELGRIQNDSQPFLATRVINLNGWRIVWYVFHESDAPYDACRVHQVIV